MSIYGSGFKAGAMVTLNGAATDVIVIDSHGITASTAAAAPGIVDVVVTNPDGQSGRLTGGYTYLTATGIARELRISGPVSLAPGATGQYTAVASYDDGSSHDVTSTVQWLSSSPARVAIGADGLATAKSRGEANVVAGLNQGRQGEPGQLFSHVLNVLVLDSGEFRLTGRVTTSGRPVSNAVVEVVAGVGAGIQSFAGPSYALYGVAGDVEVRVSAYGFHPQTRTVTLSDHAIADFDLLPTNGVDKVAGVYALTVSASPVCRELLPERFRERRFDVIITDDNSGVSVTFKSSTLIETDGEWIFPATLEGPSLRLDLLPRLLEDPADRYLFALIGTMDLEIRGPGDPRNVQRQVSVVRPDGRTHGRNRLVPRRRPQRAPATPPGAGGCTPLVTEDQMTNAVHARVVAFVVLVGAGFGCAPDSLPPPPPAGPSLLAVPVPAPRPIVTSVSPARGSTGGGTPVTITGSWIPGRRDGDAGWCATGCRGWKQHDVVPGDHRPGCRRR